MISASDNQMMPNEPGGHWLGSSNGHCPGVTPRNLMIIDPAGLVAAAGVTQVGFDCLHNDSTSTDILVKTMLFIN